MKYGRMLMSLALAGSVAMAFAQPTSYGRKTTEINAGILLIESQKLGGQLYNPVPHLFYNLEQDKSTKPAGWVFTTPLGQSTLTADARNRWASTGAPAVGARVTKRDAPFWEVPLASTDAATLEKFDILVLPLARTLSLNSSEREKIRRYVDQGGVLWVDVTVDTSGLINVAQDSANGLPLGFNLRAMGGSLNFNPLHPLLQFPNQLSLDELLLMQAQGLSSVATTVDLTGTGLERVLGPVVPDSFRLEPVAGLSVAQRSITSGRLGDGYIVVTTRGITKTINRGFDPTSAFPAVVANDQYGGLEPVTDGAYFAAVKFAVNTLSLAANSESSGSSRKMNASSVPIDPPLLKRFEDAMGGFTPNKPPAIFRGYIVATNSAGQVRAYWADTKRGLGTQGGQAWPAPINLGAGASAPVCVSVPNTALPTSGTQEVDQVWVTDGNGAVHVIGLHSGVELKVIQPPTGSLADSDGPYAPTIHEGLVFIADARASDGNGRVWAIDLATGDNVAPGGSKWSIEGTPRIGKPSASPTVGYVPIADNSGGMDRVVYVPYKNSTGIPSRPAGFVSVWLGARGENPVRVTKESSTQIRITTRASLNGLPLYLPPGSSSHGVRISLVKPNGTPFTVTEMAQIFDGTILPVGNGEFRATLKASAPTWDWDGTSTPGDVTDDVGWRIDYTIDWGAVSTGLGGIPADSFVRGNLEMPDDSSNSRQILGNLALGPGGYLYAITSGTTANSKGGTLLCFREEGRGEFRTSYRWDLYEAIKVQMNVGNGTPTVVNLPPAVVDEDPIRAMAGGLLNGQMANLRFSSGPTVHGENVYVHAIGYKTIMGFPVPTSMLMCFKARMAPLEFTIDGPGRGVVLMQPDVARSLSKDTPETLSTLQTNQFTLEPLDTTDTHYRIVINNVATTQRGRLRDSLSSSLPVILRRSGQTDQLLEPEALAENPTVHTENGQAFQRYNPLRWYIVFNGQSAKTPPIVAGDTVYSAGMSYLPDIIANGLAGIPNAKGMIFGLDANLSPSDTFLHPNSVRPWVSQLYTIKISPNKIEAAPAIRWPQFGGVQNFDDFRVRLLQTALVDDPEAINISAGEGSLAVTGATNLYSFGQSDFLVVDEGRVARFDPAGYPVWSANQTLSAGKEGPVSGVMSFRTLSKPQRFYPSDTNGFWIVDTGNDRVVRIDGGGREVRSIDGFKLHPSFTPSGYSANETLNLRQPKDILVYKTNHTMAEARSYFPDASGPELWNHVVIADSGNNRIVEVVDRYSVDPNNGAVLGIVKYVDPNSTRPGGVETATGLLFWHTPAELTGKKYSYNCLQRVWLGSGASIHPAYLFGFGNVQPGRASFGLDTPTDTPSPDVSSGYGGVVVLDGSTPLIVTEFQTPAVPVNAYLAQTSPGVFSFATAADPGGLHKISGLTSATASVQMTPAGPQLCILICDSTGIYEIYQDPTDKVWKVRWMLPMSAYVGMRRPKGAGPFLVGDVGTNPQRLRAMYARRLESGDILMVNGYFGNYLNGNPFNGQVAVIDGRIGNGAGYQGYDVNQPNLGYNPLSILYELPPVTGIRGIVNPTFAERQ